MKRILIAQVARIERERRMARDTGSQLALHVPSPDASYARASAAGVEPSTAVFSFMMSQGYRRT
jgi:hypothetical protein